MISDLQTLEKLEIKKKKKHTHSNSRDWEKASIAGDTRNVCSILGLGRSPGGENGNAPQYSCLENSMNRGAW